ncbi:cobalamin biosynthesis protein [Yinghuangia sp. ASG 101]|uniref:cobalamin biosynthesis protein n=1 Tax=Yinghuangia sp. ASG 101 TaxID=2896848 RepID=UPI001E5AAB47|nr:cobalamin biosynthesis protein [Yinghuangia sp. ASG 101]UGQ10226.1 cobalamin biosynthesis protein [Yinghuangia sp. ASG 101]
MPIRPPKRTPAVARTTRPAPTGSIPALGLVLGVAADAAVGDPRRGHPVALFGTAAGALERRMYADSRARGAAYTALCVAGTAALGVAADRLTRRHPAARVLVTAAATWAVLGGTTLRREAHAIAVPLLADPDAPVGLAAARARLPHLVGRDPSALDATQISRAVVESVAENTSDAVVAPLFWGAVAGLPGLLAYRAVNTLDAMVGHKSPRYLHFGWASARLDDAANWAPARLTGLLTVAAAPLVGGSPRATHRVLRRDARAHPSPNSGHCEAAAAGALGVRLGGRNIYAGCSEDRPPLGDGRPPTPRDVPRAARLATAVCLAAAAIATTALRATSGLRRVARPPRRR